VDPFTEYSPFIIYRCATGSRAYGLDVEGSDTDLRGIYLPPAARHWSLAGVPEQIEDKENEEIYWELQKFLRLALKGNPTVLECLYTPIVLDISPLGEELLAMRSIFLSRMIYQTYNGYAIEQFRKFERQRASGTIRWKHAMHLIRLLLSGIAALRDGEIPVRVGEHRERLLSIRHGAMEWDEVDEWRRTLHNEFERAYARTTLPELPDHPRADAFLIRTRRAMVG